MFLTRWVRRQQTSSPITRGKRRKATCRPRLEALETRLTPATWDGGSLTSNNWSDRFNWVGDIAPAAGDTLFFPTDAARKQTGFNDFGTATVPTDFGGIGLTGGGYQLQGNPVRLGTGGITMNDPLNQGTNFVDLNLVLPGPRTITVVQTTFGNALNLRGVVSGTGGIVKQGDGSATIGNTANNYSGVTQVADGTLVVTKPGSLGASGAASGTEVLAGGSLEIDLFPSSPATFAEPLSLDGLGHNGDGALEVDNSGITWSGPIFLAGDTRINGGLSFEITGGISGGTASDLSLVGNARLSANNTYGGLTTIDGGAVIAAHVNALGSPSTNGTRVLSGGTLQLVNGITYGERLFLNGGGQGSGNGALSLSSATPAAGAATYAGNILIESDAEIFSDQGDQLTLTGDLTGLATATLSIGGRGEVRYSFDPTSVVSFAGTTSIDEGTLTLNTPGRNVVLGDLRLDPRFGTSTPTARLLGSNQIANGGTVVFDGGGLLDLNNHSDVIGGLNMTGGSVTTGTGTVVLAGNVVTNASDDSASISGKLSLGTASRTFDIADGAANDDLRISADITASTGVNLTKNGSGNLSLQGNNSVMLGQFVVNGGFLTPGTDTALGTTGTAAGVSTVVNSGGTLLVTAGRNLAETIRINGNGNNANGGAISNSGNNTISGNIVVESDATIRVSSDRMILSGAITDLVTGGPTLNKTGTGTLEYTNAATNTFDGTTNVAEGTLELSKDGSGRAVRGSLSIGEGAVVRLLAPDQIGDSVGVTVDGTLTLNGFSDTFGTLTMTDGNVQTGVGTLTLNGHVTTNASAAQSVIGGNLSLGVITTGGSFTRFFTVADGGALNDLLVTATITSTGTVNLGKAGPGRMELGGTSANTYAGGTAAQDGVLSLDKPDGVAALGGGAVAVPDGLPGAGQPRLVLESDNQIPDARTFIVNVNGVFDLNGHQETLNTLTMNGGRVETGAGTLTVASKVQSTGSTVTSVINGKLALTDSTTDFVVTDNPAVADDLVVNAVISGTGGIFMNGQTGRMVLTAANTQTGITTVRRGTLELRGGSLNSSDVNVFSFTTRPEAVLVVGAGTSSVKSLDLIRGVVTLGGTLNVNQDVNLVASTPGNLDGLLDVVVGGTQVGQFGRIVADSIEIGTGQVELQVRLTADVTTTDNMQILTDNSGVQLTGRRFENLPGDPDDFDAQGPAVGQTTPFLVDYAAGDDNDIVIRRNTPSMFPNRAVTPVVEEGGFATLTGTIGDPDRTDTFFLTVNWGDGTPSETHVFLPNAPRQVSLRHRYRDNPAGEPVGQYVIQLHWEDQHGEGNSGVLAVTVENTDPVVVVRGGTPIRTGRVLSHIGFIDDAGVLDTHTATVDYGDGSEVENLEVRPDGSFRMRHRYNRPGVYLVTVTATDDDGAVGRTTFMVIVSGGGNGKLGGRALDDDDGIFGSPFGGLNLN